MLRADLAQVKRDRVEFEMKIEALSKSQAESERQAAEYMTRLQQPAKDRKAKVDFVNSLELEVKKSNSLLLVGPKGMGKSTFLWLLGKGAEPERSYADGTVGLIQKNGFQDTIGLRGWTPEELYKLLVLLIYEGIPNDIIIFNNDRINTPINALAVMGVINPMIVMMSSEFWANYGRQKIHLIESANKVKRVQPVDDLYMVYKLEAYEDVKELSIGTPITHHDNLEELVARRSAAGIRPFEGLMTVLGDVLKIPETAATENLTADEISRSVVMEALFRLIYIFEKKYKRDALKFMNNASLSEFE